MASKMSAACDASNTPITISMAESEICRKPLKCEFCNASVGFVKGHFRTVGDDSVYVSPFFRLNQGQRHSKTCQYDVHGQITVIARESESDILVAINEQRYELRLLAVKKAFEDLNELDWKAKSSNAEVVPHTTEKIYIEAETRLGGYINTAQRVLKVRTACEKHSEIEAALHLVFEDKRLRWRDFYFEDDHHFSCFSKVDLNTVQVPVAIKGTVKTKVVVKNKYAVINLFPTNRKTDLVDVLDVTCFSIWSTDLNTFKCHEEGSGILAFGIWKSRGVKESDNKNTDSPIKVFRNHELSLWPTIKSQLCVVNN
jgi:hypothetical protein